MSLVVRRCGPSAMNDDEARQVESVAPRPSLSARMTLPEIATDAIRYWETRRVIYNAVLVLVVVGCFVAAWPASRATVTFENAVTLVVLAVLANVCYCAAYLVDVFAQISDFRAMWRRWRWILFAIGVAFAAILTQVISLEFFDPLFAD